MKKSSKIAISAAYLISLVLIISFYPVGALAEDQTTRSKSARETLDLGAITVTAKKQEENVQDVSLSLTVMDALDIEDMKIESVNDIADFVPNMMNYNDGKATVNKVIIRGISTPGFARHATAVAMYVDGVPTLGNFGFEEGIVDVERIEVLRGPQGTLYGKNTQAGAINIITRRPDNEFRLRVSAEAGQWMTSESGDKLTSGATMSLSGPILKDKLFYSLAGVYKHKDGYIENTTNNESEFERDNTFSRIKLRWVPTEDLDISILSSSLLYDQKGNNMDLGEGAAASFAMLGLSEPKTRYQTASGFVGSQESKSDSQSLKISYDLSDSVNLTSITSRKKTTFSGTNDFDFSPMHIMHSSSDGIGSETTSQELRLDSETERLNWLAGLYFDSEKRDDNYSQTSMIPAMNFATDTQLTGNAQALFGQVGYFLTEKIKLIGGLRYERQYFEIEGLFPAEELDDSWEKVSPKIAAEYHATQDLMTYIDISEGYRTGGFNEQAMDPEYYNYDDESLWSYEIGIKSLLLNKSLMLNAAFFYMDIKDMQVQETINTTLTYVTNAAEATSKGIELELTARVTDSLSLMGGCGYTDIKFRKFSDADGDYEGNKNPFSPDYTYNISAQYRQQNSFYARLDLIGYGEMYYDIANEYSREAYQLVNAKVGYEMDHFDIYLYGKNISNEEYDSNDFFKVYSAPGEYGLQIVGRF